jgi:hypothetical protein
MLDKFSNGGIMKSTILILFSILISLTASGCMGKSNPPFKPYDRIPVPDGEFLQYGKYIGGEKVVTINFISKIISNHNNETVLLNYMDAVRAKSGDRFPENYKDYCSRRTISLKTGSLIELTYDFSRTTNTNLNLTDKHDPSRYGGEFYRHYTLNSNVMDMEIKTCNKSEIRDIRYRESVKNGYPVMDTDTAMLFSFRFLDITKPGILYAIAPAIIKEPLPVSCRILGKEKIKTSAGEFNTFKITIILSDPFLGELMDNYLKDSNLWIEDSARRLLVKMQAAGIRMEIESISNVNKKHAGVTD